MTRKGFFALVGTLALLLVVMVGAWSYSTGTVDSDGSLNITGPEKALIGTPDFASGGPVVSEYRGSDDKGYFDIDVNTENTVTLTLDLDYAVSGLGAEVWVEGDQGVVKINPLGSSSFAIGEYIVKAKLSATGTGFSADIDLEIPVEVKNAPIVAKNDSVETPENTAVTITVLDNDSHPDGPMMITSVDLTDTVYESVTYTTSEVEFTPAQDWTGTTTFKYSVEGDGETKSATVTVTVPTT